MSKWDSTLWSFTSLNTYNPVHQETIQVNKSDFRPSKKNRDFLGFFYNIEKAALQDGEVYWLELWFETPDGRKLYGATRKP